MEHRWDDWLRQRFDEHPQVRRPADLVRAGGEKPNGRPVIDASTITQWLKGRRPSYALAVATARAFGSDISSALRAAGYAEEEAPTSAATESRPAPETGGGSVGGDAEDPEEMVFRLRVPPNATPRQREAARRAAEASVRAVLEALDAEE